LYSSECLSFIWIPVRTGTQAAYPPTSGEQPYRVGIHGLATRKPYSFLCRHKNGELLPRLFTLTLRIRRLFSVTLLCPYEQLPVRKCGALCCPDFPLFEKQKATSRFTACAKI